MSAASRRRMRWTLVLAVLASGAALWYRLRDPQAARSAANPKVKVIRVASGSTTRILRVTGTTSARTFASVNAPVMNGPDGGRALILKWLAKSGEPVKAGEVIAQIDDQSIRDHADDVGAQVQQAEGAIKKRGAEQSIELETLRQNIRSAKATLDKAKLDYAAQAIRTEIDREILKLAVDEAEASYNNLVASLDITLKKFDAQMKLLEFQKIQQERHHERHVKDTEHFAVHAPIGGLFVLNTIFRGGDFGQVQQGDQLNPGQPFAKVVDSRTMQLDSTVNQAESQTVRIGQPAKVHLDAFPSLEITGKVTSIGALGVSGGFSAYWVRNVTVRVAIDGAHQQVIPDLSASADLEIGRPQDGVLVPLEALGVTPAGAAVSVRDGAGWKEVPVTVSSRTNTMATVTSGLHAGDEIAVSRP